jgi:hypothetical protein
MIEWLSIASYNIKCYDYAIQRNRTKIRNFTIFGLIVSTLSGTLSVGQLGILYESQRTKDIMNGVFAVLTYSIAVYTGYIKVYQVQELFEQYIKIKQEWIVFASAVASELQLPIELRRDALHIIMKFKGIYLDLLKYDIEVPNDLRALAERTLPQLPSMKLNVTSLPNIIMDIGIQELNDLAAQGKRNKDRFSTCPAPAAAKNPVIAPARLRTSTSSAFTSVATAPAPAPASVSSSYDASKLPPIDEHEAVSVTSDSPSSVTLHIHPTM